MKKKTTEAAGVDSGIEDILIAINKIHRDNEKMLALMDKMTRILTAIGVSSQGTFEETRKTALSAKNIRNEIAPESGNSSRA